MLGDFTTTSLAYSTIHINGSLGNDTIDISELTSAHRVVFASNGGSDTVIGEVRPQDVFAGMSASGLHLGAGNNTIGRTIYRSTILVVADLEIDAVQTVRGPAADIQRRHAFDSIENPMVMPRRARTLWSSEIATGGA